MQEELAAAEQVLAKAKPKTKPYDTAAAAVAAKKKALEALALKYGFATKLTSWIAVCENEVFAAVPMKSEVVASQTTTPASTTPAAAPKVESKPAPSQTISTTVYHDAVYVPAPAAPPAAGPAPQARREEEREKRQQEPQQQQQQKLSQATASYAAPAAPPSAAPAASPSAASSASLRAGPSRAAESSADEEEAAPSRVTSLLCLCSLCADLQPQSDASAKKKKEVSFARKSAAGGKSSRDSSSNYNSNGGDASYQSAAPASYSVSNPCIVVSFSCVLVSLTRCSPQRHLRDTTLRPRNASRDGFGLDCCCCLGCWCVCSFYRCRASVAVASFLVAAVLLSWCVCVCVTQKEIKKTFRWVSTYTEAVGNPEAVGKIAKLASAEGKRGDSDKLKDVWTGKMREIERERESKMQEETHLAVGRLLQAG